MNLDTCTLKKRAVYTGLQSYLCKTELMEALLLVERGYAQQSYFPVRYYASELAKHLKREKETKDILMQLVVSMNKSEAELLPDPSRALEHYKQKKYKHTTEIKLPEIEAFKVLVSKLLTLCASPSVLDVTHFVRTNLVRLDIDLELRVQTDRWLANEDFELQPKVVKTQDLRKIINLFYIGFCEYIGPTKADRLLFETVTSAKTNGGAAYADTITKLL